MNNDVLFKWVYLSFDCSKRSENEYIHFPCQSVKSGWNRIEGRGNKDFEKRGSKVCLKIKMEGCNPYQNYGVRRSSKTCEGH